MVRSLTLRRKKTRRHARTKKLNKRKRFTKKVKSTRRRRVRRTLTRRKQKGGNEDEDVKVDSVELDNGMGDKSGKRRARSLG